MARVERQHTEEPFFGLLHVAQAHGRLRLPEQVDQVAALVEQAQAFQRPHMVRSDAEHTLVERRSPGLVARQPGAVGLRQQDGLHAFLLQGQAGAQLGIAGIALYAGLELGQPLFVAARIDLLHGIAVDRAGAARQHQCQAQRRQPAAGVHYVAHGSPPPVSVCGIDSGRYISTICPLWRLSTR